ncbi:MAG TPA: hypothetical protein VM364_03580 [Vicinamibacterales bacterium]|nr:hypothetical protein [Vicinamibacterales bacterium]
MTISLSLVTRRRWAELLGRLRSAGQAMPIKDSLIAATALAHDLTVATRYRVAGVPVVDPFEEDDRRQ